MFGCFSRCPLHVDRVVTAELLVVEPQFEAYVCGAYEDADGVFDAEVVFLEGPEVFVLLDEALFVCGGEIGVDFAEDACICTIYQRRLCLFWLNTYVRSSDQVVSQPQDCFR